MSINAALDAVLGEYPMSSSKLTAMEVFKSTRRDNCGECRLPGCMAFAAQALQGQVNPSACPYLDLGVFERIARERSERAPERAGEDRSALIRLKAKVGAVDFTEAAARLGGEVRGDRIAIRCLGKVFEIDRAGELHAECHVNDWLHFPLLTYLTRDPGPPMPGRWISFREISGAQAWAPFFQHRCEKVLHELADAHDELFLDILDLFGDPHDLGVAAPTHAWRLQPFPRVPWVIAYWAREGRFESKLSVLFDRSIESYLGPEAVYILGSGLTQMFQKIAARHAPA